VVRAGCTFRPIHRSSSCGLAPYGWVGAGGWVRGTRSADGAVHSWVSMSSVRLFEGGGTRSGARCRPDWIQNPTFTSPSTRQRGAPKRYRKERDRFRGGAVWWYSPGRASYSILRLG